ncbi:SGNH/GDSL hydrolase family protein [Leptolyngbya sp. FACHB-261]|uniref:SGNH/GDSL hydrolase family protein n=1 Tax=Leptolyngbya sp. FACHB-261 TaxID=2692806 RepID=UPI0016868ADF|nr:SGNH/GDSL hydrolase family protein [Leptolyngbya sp. FACHB-261]MBD2103679.1 SGNH/GDSL hydrolase family protein [Leptolyngbya sp. FACHB-261]
MLNVFKIIAAYRAANRVLDTEDSVTDALLAHFQPPELQQKHCTFDSIYVFGDSLSDIGNTFDLTQEALGQGLPPAPPYFRGRFSNGPVWVEYLARLLKLSSEDHINFAVSGATTGRTNIFIPNNPANLLGLQQQLDSFTASFKATEQQANAKALYTIWAGANDYLNSNLDNSPANPPANPQINLQANSMTPVENLANGVKALADVGAKQIMVANLPDLGDFPGLSRDSQRTANLNTLTQAHNSGLATALQALSQSVEPDVNIISFDVNSLFKQVVAEPSRFGFTDVINTELDQLAQFQGYTDTFFFWDIIHPTTTAHLILAKAAFSLLSPTTRLTERLTG